MTYNFPEDRDCDRCGVRLEPDRTGWAGPLGGPYTYSHRLHGYQECSLNILREVRDLLLERRDG